MGNQQSVLRPEGSYKTQACECLELEHTPCSMPAHQDKGSLVATNTSSAHQAFVNRSPAAYLVFCSFLFRLKTKRTSSMGLGAVGLGWPSW